MGLGKREVTAHRLRQRCGVDALANVQPHPGGDLFDLGDLGGDQRAGGARFAAHADAGFVFEALELLGLGEVLHRIGAVGLRVVEVARGRVVGGQPRQHHARLAVERPFARHRRSRPPALRPRSGVELRFFALRLELMVLRGLAVLLGGEGGAAAQRQQRDQMNRFHGCSSHALREGKQHQPFQRLSSLVISSTVTGIRLTPMQIAKSSGASG
ncbi:MAG: hypothetical protein QM723_08230 [Myxococcaceae bacterium]